jgi:hypothetical protein
VARNRSFCEREGGGAEEKTSIKLQLNNI